jgi:glycosyltransferase involved in cell wall biosynthesis
MITSGNISLVIPLYNESSTIDLLLDTIDRQTLQPHEVILVDAGSTDNTVQLIREHKTGSLIYRIIKEGRAMPGEARNTGVKNASTEWIAFTDAGIKLDQRWLENLVNKVKEDEGVGILYGNYSPVCDTFFTKCAAIAYVSPAKPGEVRGKFIASSLLKKEAWQKVGGFPNWRAAEDLMFMERVEELGYKKAFAPEAMVWWELRKDLPSTYRKFVLYSMHNVWAGRQRYWHYGVARQYSLVLLFILLGIFYHGYWFLLVPVWLVARTAKKIIQHRYEFGIKTLFNPAVWGLVALITLVIDTATFSGWAKAVWKKGGSF